ncbi:MAG: sugar phosphate isomerase/epimerase [Planctomycetes bacterium]|nr:sugar phosphate isomerase/epimerase [Planctomycetota bacterium]
MPDLKTAIMLGNLKMDPYEGMKVVADMGVPAIHLSASGPFAPDKLDAAGRKKLVSHLESLGLEISAISAWGGNVDLGEADKQAENVAAGRKLLELSRDLGPAIWQAHVGIMPHETSDPAWQIFVDSFKQLAEHGEKVGACLAIETGPEPPAVLKRLIETVGSEAIRVNYDPANLILWPARYMKDAGEPYDKEKATREYQPTEGVKILGEYIVHTHAKDALVREDGQRQEVPLGTGWVEWPRYIELLSEAGYDGYFAIERETGEDPVGDIRRAVEFLRGL